MAYTLQRRIYERVDGTNISEFRCDQYLLLMSMCEELGERTITYTDIQSEAIRRTLFGANTKADSAVRTICPILFKFGFLRPYQNASFPANEFFTPAGKMFVKVLSALQKTNSLSTMNEELENKLSDAKTKAIQLGLLNMSFSKPNHKMWLLVYALKILGSVNKNVYYYMLRAIQEGDSVSDAIEEVEIEPTIADDDYLREDGNEMDSTSIGYLLANLKNAGLISDSVDGEYLPTEDFDLFFSLLKETHCEIPNTYLSLVYECN